MKRLIVAAIGLLSASAIAQTLIQPVWPQFNSGTLGVANAYQIGTLWTSAFESNLSRFEYFTEVTSGALHVHDRVDIACDGDGTSACFGGLRTFFNVGASLMIGDSIAVRQSPTSAGPVIGRSTSVRAKASTWAAWADHYKLGPGAKAAIFVGGDDPHDEGLMYHSVPKVIVIGNSLNVTEAVIKWNTVDGVVNGALFRIVGADGQTTAELTADGVLRVKRVEIIP